MRWRINPSRWKDATKPVQMKYEPNETCVLRISCVLVPLGARQRDVWWTCVFDTTAPDAPRRTFEQISEFPLQGRSLAVLRAEHP
jgi:hypothetical protein